MQTGRNPWSWPVFNKSLLHIWLKNCGSGLIFSCGINISFPFQHPGPGSPISWEPSYTHKASSKSLDDWRSQLLGQSCQVGNHGTGLLERCGRMVSSDKEGPAATGGLKANKPLQHMAWGHPSWEIPENGPDQSTSLGHYLIFSKTCFKFGSK